MGMYDNFRSSYPLGEQFTDVVCQTKTIEEYGLGGTMTDYWLDPAGVLWYADCRDTHTYEILKEGDKGYDPNDIFNIQWISTEKHGRVKPHPISKVVIIYPVGYKGSWRERPELSLYFRDGVLQEFWREKPELSLYFRDGVLQEFW